MKVACFVNPDYGGGIARHTREMVAGLARHPGTAVEIVTSRSSMRRNPELAGSFRGLPVQHLPFANVTIERLWKAFGRPRIDHYVSADCDVIYAPAHARLPSRRLPTVMTIHDMQSYETNLPWSHTSDHLRFRRKWRTWLPQACREATRILTVSEFSRRRIAELVDVPASKIGVVGNGVSEVFFLAGLASHRKPAPSIVVVGGLRTKKGAADTLAVARVLAARRSPLHIDVIGTHEPLWLEAARCVPNLTLHGILSDESLADRMARASGLLFLSPYEGFGIPAIEAMATGTPAVVADAAALPETIGSAGVVVNAAHHEHVADVLQRLYDDVRWRQGLVAQGRVHAARYTWQACVERLRHQLDLATSGAGPSLSRCTPTTWEDSEP